MEIGVLGVMDIMKRLKLEAEDLVLVYADTGKLAGVYDNKTPLEKLPKNTVAVPSQPDNGLDTYDPVNKVWKPYEPPYDEKRKQEYNEKLGDQGDQNDAIYKGVTGAIALMKEMGATDAQLRKYGLFADKDAEPGTPAYWLGTTEDIKTRNPKPNKE